MVAGSNDEVLEYLAGFYELPLPALEDAAAPEAGAAGSDRRGSAWLASPCGRSLEECVEGPGSAGMPRPREPWCALGWASARLGVV